MTGASNRVSQYMTMTAAMTPQDDQGSRISTFHGEGRGYQHDGRGRGRGCGRGRNNRGRGGRGRGRGRFGGRGRHSRGYNPYSMSRGGYNSFTAEARSYLPEEWERLSGYQKEAVIKAKQEAGWINSYTPPEGFTLDQDGRPTPSTSLVAAVQSVIGQVSQQGQNIPPPPNDGIPPAPALPPIVETNSQTAASQAGHAFGRTGQRNSSSSISTMTRSQIIVNGQPINEAYDRDGNRL